MKCDFCSSPAVRWRYPARDVNMGVVLSGGKSVMHNSRGDWAACDTCHDMIEAGDYTSLLNRSIERFPGPAEQVFLPPSLIAGSVTSAHRAFRNACKDAPVPFNRGETQ